MNFNDLLDWISGRTKAEEPSIPHTRERRRFQRIDLGAGEVLIGRQGPFPVGNLSYGGLRIDLADPDDGVFIAVGEEYEAEIHFQEVRFTTKLLICSRLGNCIGCSFTRLSSAHARIVSDYLKPRIIGASLQEISGAKLQCDEPNVRMRWFQGEDGAQIFLWQALDGELIKEEYYFMNYVITWDDKQQFLQTGKIIDSSSKVGYGRIDPNTVAFFQVPSHRALKMGKVILEFSDLPVEAKDHLLASIAREERRLYNRYVLSRNDIRILFHPTLEPGTELEVANLSLTGIALLVPEGRTTERIRLEELISGTLHLAAGNVPIQIQIIYQSSQVVGGAMVISEESAEKLARFLGPRIMGQSLEELPAPLDELPLAPSNSRATLFIGIHNTHVLSLICSSGKLVAGRIVFMDQMLMFSRKGLQACACQRGIIFPRDWDVAPELIDVLPEVGADLLATCAEMIAVAPIPEEVKRAWNEHLVPAPNE